LFAKTGFELVEIDAKSHFGANIAIGKKTHNSSLPFTVDKTTIETVTVEYKKIADYWSTLQSSIRNFETSLGNEEVAIYGAGVYGNFILTSLANSNNVKCFVDQNPLLHHKHILSKIVMYPDELPANIKTVYVGLNPRIARKAIPDIKNWQDREMTFFYL
jgi:FlaA1/EpsC-like NDP-sugar epimerase